MEFAIPDPNQRQPIEGEPSQPPVNPIESVEHDIDRFEDEGGGQSAFTPRPVRSEDKPLSEVPEGHATTENDPGADMEAEGAPPLERDDNGYSQAA